MSKVRITQDTLYAYMMAHDLKMIRLSEMIGCSDDTVTACFQHRKDRHGTPRRLSEHFIMKINDILPCLANELRDHLITFGSDQKYTNKHGRTYDPGMIKPLKELGKYLNITGLTSRLLGWTKNKKSLVLVNTASASYGNISEADIILINNEILSIVGVLSSCELIEDRENKNVNH